MFYETTASSVELPADLEVLGGHAFANTQNIHEVLLPDTVRVIGEGAFLNMRGLMRLNLPEGIEELPENMTASTTTDVIVIPESVKKICQYAIFDANIVVIQNPDVEIETAGIDGDYILIKNAKNFVFPENTENVIRGSRVYLDGIYDTNDIKGDLYNSTSIASQFFLPMDATESESDALDSYLASIGYDELAWIAGSSADFIPDSTYDFDSKGNQITGYHGDSRKLSIPDYVMQTDGTFWYTSNVYSIADEAFALDCMERAKMRRSLDAAWHTEPVRTAAWCVLPTCVTYFRKEPDLRQYLLRLVLQLILIQAEVILLIAPPADGSVSPVRFYGTLGVTVFVIYAAVMLMFWLQKVRQSRKLTQQLIEFQKGQTE